MGLSYAQQRWYAPEVGRFLSQDPVFGDPASPSSMHAFGYANGNPSRFIDPHGTQGLDTCSAGGPKCPVPPAPRYPNPLSRALPDSAVGPQTYNPTPFVPKTPPPAGPGIFQTIATHAKTVGASIAGAVVGYWTADQVAEQERRRTEETNREIFRLAVQNCGAANPGACQVADEYRATGMREDLAWGPGVRGEPILDPAPPGGVPVEAPGADRGNVITDPSAGGPPMIAPGNGEAPAVAPGADSGAGSYSLAPRPDDVRGSSPVPIPASATVTEQQKTGYEQIRFRWSDARFKYEARWHTRTPGAPLGQGNTWVITKTTPETPTGQPKVEHILTGDNQWTPMQQWQDAVKARQQGTATAEQQELLERGHWPAP